MQTASEISKQDKDLVTIKCVEGWLSVVFGICLVTYAFLHRPMDYDAQATQAIVGEASNQSFDTMMCVAHAIRNRGNLKGVYGLWAKHVWTEPEEVWRNARIAWEMSDKEPTTVGRSRFWGTYGEVLKRHPEHVKMYQCGDLYFW